VRRRSKATSSGCGGSRRRRRSSSAGSEVPLPISSRSPALKTPPLVASGADARWAGRRRARALGRRGGRHRPLPVHRAPPVPELLLGRRRCVPIPLVRSRSAPSTHSPSSSSHLSSNFTRMRDVPGRALLRDCSDCSYDAPVGTDVLSLLHKDCHTSRLSMHPLGQPRTYISVCRCNDQANWFGVCC